MALQILALYLNITCDDQHMNNKWIIKVIYLNIESGTEWMKWMKMQLKVARNSLDLPIFGIAGFHCHATKK